MGDVPVVTTRTEAWMVDAQGNRIPETAPGISIDPISSTVSQQKFLDLQTQEATRLRQMAEYTFANAPADELKMMDTRFRSFTTQQIAGLKPQEKIIYEVWKEKRGSTSTVMAAVFAGAFVGAAVFGSAASGAPFLDVATSVSGAVGAAAGYVAGRIIGGDGWSKDVAPIALSFLVPAIVGGQFDGVVATIAVGACVGGFGAESYFK